MVSAGLALAQDRSCGSLVLGGNLRHPLGPQTGRGVGPLPRNHVGIHRIVFVRVRVRPTWPRDQRESVIFRLFQDK